MLIFLQEVIDMRIWNGLNVNDRVKYKDKEYIVKELYEENNIRLCNLITNDERRIVLEGISVKECKKLL